MLNPSVLEILNGSLAASGLVLLVVFARYLISAESTERGREACRAVAVFVLGETIVRGWLWLWRNQINDGLDVAWMLPYPVPALGGAIALVGVFCMLRVFSVIPWPAWVWVTISALTVGAITIFAVM